jgi:aspartate aminotransferase
VVLISDPCNPTGKALSKGTINLLCKQAAKVSADIIWDEAYRGFMRNASAHPFGIRVRSFSKEFHLEGWRIGYAIVPEELRTALVKFIVTTVTAVSEPMQRVAYACLTAERAIMRRNLPLWEQRLNFLSARLKKLGFEFHVPDCGMYIFARHPRIDDATVFCERALEKGLALAPGIAFGPYPEFIRISAAASREEMKRAMNIVAECLS